MKNSFISEFKEREYFNQCTNSEELDSLMNNKKINLNTTLLKQNFLYKLKGKMFVIFFIIFCFGWNPKTVMLGDVASFPGLFNSWEQQRGFFQNSSKGKEIWGDLTKKTNSTLVMYNPVGPVMSISSARELTGIDAMKGLKARRLLKSEEPMWDALGANRVSLKTGEVYNA